MSGRAQRGPRRRELLLVALIALATLAAYLPALECGFTNWDDDRYVLANPHIQSLEPSALAALVTLFYMGNWHPLTMLSYAVEHAVAGTDPFLYHVTNVLLHLLVTLLVYLLLRRMSGSRVVAAGAALLFGVHPLHVESVAWVSERKDVLMAVFFFAAAALYQRYLRAPRAGVYLGVFALFVLSLLSKGMAVTLPIVLLLQDAASGRKLEKRVLAEKIPFVLAALAVGAVAVAAQGSVDAITTATSFTLLQRALIAAYNLLFYLVTLALPVRLSAWYPYPPLEGGMLPWPYLVAPFVVALLGLLLWMRRRGPAALWFGALFFAVTVAPVLQFLPVGGALAADRYAYIPSAGIFFLASALAVAAHERLQRRGAPLRFLVPALAGAALLCLAVMTRERCGVWTDSVALWTDAIAKHPDVALPYAMRGRAWQEAKEHERAREDFDLALAVNPAQADILILRGVSNRETGRLPQAVDDYTAAVALAPQSALAYGNRGNAYMALGDVSRAEEDFRAVIRLRPGDATGWYQLGLSQLERRTPDAAIASFGEALRRNPDYVEAYSDRGNAYVEAGRFREAIDDYSAALERAPGDAVAWYNRGNAYLLSGQARRAVEDYDRALAIAPGMKEAAFNRARALERAVQP